MSDVPNEISSLLKAIRGTTVTVFGDFCVDAYWSLDETETELSVETGLPIRRVVAQRYSLGGAGNVVANLADLGVGNVEYRELAMGHEVTEEALALTTAWLARA